MRAIVAFLVITYLVGVGVVLAPTLRTAWNTETASQLLDHVAQELPGAVSWPATAYHRISERA
jgi:hypothetical protein